MSALICRLFLVNIFLIAFTTNTLASEKPTKEAIDSNSSNPAVLKLGKVVPNLQVKSIDTTEVPGIQEIKFVDGRSIYSLIGTDYFIEGKLLKVSADGLVDISEASGRALRASLLKTVSPKDMITYSPTAERKATLAIFTDSDCGYCQKLHREIPALNAMGIEVRYLAFPRGGVSSSTYNNLSSAWCSNNRQESLNKLKSRQTIPNATCENNPVEEQYKLGIAMGVTATPALVLNDGTLTLGYRPAAEIAKMLGI